MEETERTDEICADAGEQIPGPSAEATEPEPEEAEPTAETSGPEEPSEEPEKEDCEPEETPEAEIPSIDSRLDGISDQLAEICDRISVMDVLLESRTIPQSVFQHFNGTISGQLDKVKMSLTADILKEIIKFREDMARFLANAHEKKDELTVDSLLNSFDNFDYGLLNILECRGVSCTRAEIGTAFDSKTQKIVPPAVPTGDKELDKTIQSIKTDCYELEGKVIYPSQVKVFKYNGE